MPYRDEQPIDRSQALKGVLKNFITFLHSKDKHAYKSVPTMRSDVTNEKMPTISTSNSVNCYIHYRKTVDNKLAEINNNISEMLIESFKGIDSICTKVRECVSDFGHEQVSPRCIEADPHEPNNFQNVDDGTTENLLESIHEATERSTKIEELEGENDTGSAYLIESFVTSEEACSKEHVTEMKEPNLLEEITKPILPNFITVVGDGHSTALVEDSVKNKAVRRKISRNEKRRKLLDNLRESLKLDVENADFDYLQGLIENVTEQIDVLGYQSLGENSELKKICKTIKPKVTSKDQEDRSSPPGLNDSADKTKCALKIPEVYHRPAVTNIHKRLLWQMEANDSFATFQKLMRKQKNKNGKIDSPITQINIPITSDTHSCFLQQPKILSKKNVKEEDEVKVDLRSKYSDSLWFNGKKLYKVSKGQKKHAVKKEKTKSAPKSKTRKRSNMNIGQKSTKSAAACGCSVTVTNNTPVIKNYCSGRPNPIGPRTKVQVGRRKLAYLDILDDLTNRDLLPLHSEYPRKDHLHVNEEQNFKDVHDSYLYKIMYGTNEKNTGIWNHLLQPNIECCDSACAFCNHKKNKNKKTPSIKSQNEKRKMLLDNSNKAPFADKTTSVSAKKKRIMKTLAPYMFHPEFERNGNFQSLVVMPVRVFYDKDPNTSGGVAATNLNNPKISTVPLPLVPIKEIRVNRARWVNPAGVKKTVKKMDSPKPAADQANLKSLAGNKNNANHSKSEKTDSAKSVNTSYENKHPKDIQDSYRKANKNLDKLMVKHPVGFEGKSRTSPLVNRSYNNVQPKGEFQLKMSQKSGKTLGKQLEALKSRSDILDGNRETIEKCSSFLSTKNKFQSMKLQNKSEKNDSSTKHKKMLYHLKGLKEKNCQIQNNIQKAIGVIESKMVDALSSPCNNASAEAFDFMEKEINNVLDLMKNQCKDKLPPLLEISPTASVVGEIISIDSFVEEACTDSPAKETLIDSPIKEISIDSPVKKTSIDSPIKETLTNSSVKDIDSQKREGNSKKSNCLTRDKVKCKKSPNKRKVPEKFTQKTLESEKSQLPELSIRKLLESSSYQDLTQLEDVTDQMSNDILETEFNVISTDLIAKLENILYMDGHRDSSMSDIEDLNVTNNKQKYSPRNKDEKMHSSSETTLSIDEALSKSNNAESIKNSKSQTSAIKNKIKNKNAKADLPSILVETDLAAGEMIAKENIRKNDLVKIKESGEHEEKIDGIGDCISNFLVDPLSDKSSKASDPLNDNFQKSTGMDLDNFNSKSDPLTPTKTDCKQLTTNCAEEIDNKSADNYREKNRQTEDDIKLKLLPVQLNRSNPEYEAGYNSKYIREGSRKLFDFDDGKNSIDIKCDDIDEISEEDDKSDNNLEDQVNKIISRVEDIYSQLDEIQVSTKEHSAIPIFREYSPSVQEIPKQEFLPPFLDAVKRSKLITQTEPYSTNKLRKSASYYNILKFLDSITDMHADIAMEMYKVTEIHYARSVGVAITVRFSWFEHCAILSGDTKELVEKPSCLKKHSGDVCKCSKPKRVSFLVMNQIQVDTVCENKPDDNENRLDQGDHFKTNNIVVICDKRQTTDVSTEMNLTTDSIDTGKQSINSDNSTSGEMTESTSDLSFATAQSTPKIKVFYNENQKGVLSEGFYNKKSFLREDNQNAKPKVVIFREVDMSNLIKRPKYLQKFTNTAELLPANNFLLRRHLLDENNLFLLNSFYAIVYLLMFTALNMEYKCF